MIVEKSIDAMSNILEFMYQIEQESWLWGVQH
jgi:hypothetical protein